MGGDDGLKIAILLGDARMDTLGRARALVQAVQAAQPVGTRVTSIAIGLPVGDEALWRRNASWLLDGLADVVVRRLSWERVLAANARRMFAPLDLPVSLQAIERVTLPRDWGTNFLDCDQWLLVAGPEIGGVYPARPTAVFCADLAARRAPAAYAMSIHAPYWEDQTAAFRMWRQSAVAVASDPLTAADLTSYAGVSPGKVMTLIEPLDLPLPEVPARLVRDPRQLLVRIEPDDLHGVDIVFRGLRRYLAEGGQLRPVIATEAPSEAFGPQSQIPQIAFLPGPVREMLEDLPIERVVSHQRWARLLAQSGSVWITRRAGGDGRTLRQALRSGTPVLCADSSLARSAYELAGGAMTLLPPVTVDGMVDALHAFETDLAQAKPAPVRQPDAARLHREIGFVLDRLAEVRP